MSSLRFRAAENGTGVSSVEDLDGAGVAREHGILTQASKAPASFGVLQSVSRLVLDVPLLQEIINAMPVPVSVLNENLTDEAERTWFAVPDGAGHSQSDAGVVDWQQRGERTRCGDVRFLYIDRPQRYHHE